MRIVDGAGATVIVSDLNQAGWIAAIAYLPVGCLVGGPRHREASVFDIGDLDVADGDFDSEMCVDRPVSAHRDSGGVGWSRCIAAPMVKHKTCSWIGRQRNGRSLRILGAAVAVRRRVLLDRTASWRINCQRQRIAGWDDGPRVDSRRRIGQTTRVDSLDTEGVLAQ